MSLQFVIFELDNLKYAIDIEFVNEITESKKITPLPVAPNMIEGVVNLRGKIIPIINLSRVLGRVKYELNERTDNYQIMVINVSNKSYGLIIDLAKDVKSIDEDDITPINDLIYNSKGYVTSTVNLNDEIIQILSVDNILDVSSMEIQQEVKMLIAN